MGEEPEGLQVMVIIKDGSENAVTRILLVGASAAAGHTCDNRRCRPAEIRRAPETKWLHVSIGQLSGVCVGSPPEGEDDLMLSARRESLIVAPELPDDSIWQFNNCRVAICARFEVRRSSDG